jgi:HSP20 family molecular chaperone IbpA|uniref:SHSP domain-containing protein n=1 Tax=Panagrolaimus sp. PS1159 TaxID=55785 RepID=A0AC35GR41_9BILA
MTSLLNRRSSLNLPPMSPLSQTTTTFSPPESPQKQTPTWSEKHDVDRQRQKFGTKSKIIRRQSSSDWENPKSSQENSKLATVNNKDTHFQAKIDLNSWSSFDIDEIDVNVYGYDVLVHARKENPLNPNMATAEINRQYRLPDDVDLDTVKLCRNKLKKEISVDAEKRDGYGKDVSFAVFDVTNKSSVTKYI